MGMWAPVNQPRYTVFSPVKKEEPVLDLLHGHSPFRQNLPGYPQNQPIPGSMMPPPGLSNVPQGSFPVPGSRTSSLNQAFDPFVEKRGHVPQLSGQSDISMADAGINFAWEANVSVPESFQGWRRTVQTSSEYSDPHMSDPTRFGQSGTQTSSEISVRNPTTRDQSGNSILREAIGTMGLKSRNTSAALPTAGIGQSGFITAEERLALRSAGISAPVNSLESTAVNTPQHAIPPLALTPNTLDDIFAVKEEHRAEQAMIEPEDSTMARPKPTRKTRLSSSTTKAGNAPSGEIKGKKEGNKSKQVFEIVHADQRKPSFGSAQQMLNDHENDPGNKIDGKRKHSRILSRAMNSANQGPSPSRKVSKAMDMPMSDENMPPVNTLEHRVLSLRSET